MDFRDIDIDRVSFDQPRGQRVGLRYGAQQFIKVQTPRMNVRVQQQPYGTRLVLARVDCCIFFDFLKHLERLGCDDGIDIDTHPLETIYLNEDTVVFDATGSIIESSALVAGDDLEIACIVKIVGLALTRCEHDTILKSRLSIHVDQLKVYSTIDTSERGGPDIYRNGVIITNL
jgi:hypothetical protein